MWQSMSTQSKKQGEIEHDPDFEPDESVEQPFAEIEAFPEEEESKNGTENSS